MVAEQHFSLHLTANRDITSKKTERISESVMCLSPIMLSDNSPKPSTVAPSFLRS